MRDAAPLLRTTSYAILRTTNTVAPHTTSAGTPERTLVLDVDLSPYSDKKLRA